MKGFSACDNPSHKGQTNTWFTPKEYVEPLGDFDLDPCTESFRPFNIAAHNICRDEGECGLSQSWSGRVFLNPPYGKDIGKWLEKLSSHGNGIALVFARCETRWSQKAFESCDAVYFIKGRISFISSLGKKSTNASNGNMFLIWGQKNIEAVLKSGINGVLMRY